jgi:K+-transporting ATPase KdpF subunit
MWLGFGGKRRAWGTRGAVSGKNILGLVLAIAVLGYLVYALLAPERLE